MIQVIVYFSITEMLINAFKLLMKIYAAVGSWRLCYL
jgi:hypothetical protein